MANTPKRLLVCQPSNHGWGGAERSVIGMLRGLDRRHWQIFGVTRRARSADFDQALRAQCTETSALFLPYWTHPHAAASLRQRVMQHAWIILRYGGYSKSVLAIMGLIRRWRIDVVYTNTIHSPAAAIAAYVMGVPHVWHVRESLTDGEAVRFVLPQQRTCKLLFRLSHAVVCNSHYVLESTGTGAVDHSRAYVVYNGIASVGSGAAERGHALRRALGIADAALVVGMVANVSHRIKRHDHFLHVIDRIRHTLPHVVGVVFGALPDPRDPYWSQLQAQQAERVLGRHILWAGFCTDQSAMFHVIDMLVHPCATEGFGRVVVEAQMHQRPVVAAKGGGVQEIAGTHAGCVLVDPDDAAAMADAVISFARDPALRSCAGAIGHAWAMSRYAMPAYVDRMHAILDAACHRQWATP